MSPRARLTQPPCPLCKQRPSQCECYDELARRDIPLFAGPPFVFIRQVISLDEEVPVWGDRLVVTIELDDDTTRDDLRAAEPIALAWRDGLQLWQGAELATTPIGLALERLRGDGTHKRSYAQVAAELNAELERYLRRYVAFENDHEAQEAVAAAGREPHPNAKRFSLLLVDFKLKAKSQDRRGFVQARDLLLKLGGDEAALEVLVEAVAHLRAGEAPWETGGEPVTTEMVRNKLRTWEKSPTRPALTRSLRRRPAPPES